MRVETQEIKALQRVIEEELEKFPLYNSNEEIIVKDHVEGISISYPAANFQNLKAKKTRFDIQIEKGKGYIVLFHVEKEKQRQGHGRQMYEIIENLCVKLGCSKMETNPSEGTGETEFFKAMGFKDITRKGHLATTYVKELD